MDIKADEIHSPMVDEIYSPIVDEIYYSPHGG